MNLFILHFNKNRMAPRNRGLNEIRMIPRKRALSVTRMVMRKGGLSKTRMAQLYFDKIHVLVLLY